MTNKALLEQERLKYIPILPTILENLSNLAFEKKQMTEAKADQEKIQEIFPQTYGQPLVSLQQGKPSSQERLIIGVVLSGGQAAGGHNVIAGLFDAMKRVHNESRLIGFLDGPSGVVNGKYCELEEELIDQYRNTGGFDLIGSGRTKIESEEQLNKAFSTVKKLQLNGLVIIGGDDSNTNAAILAEYFMQKGLQIKVVGVPKTIDGDLKNEHVEVSFGFDTACKTYSEMIGNIARDAISARKYYHFVKLMGRSASHIALECALQVRPNFTFISEEVKEKKQTLEDVVQSLVELIVKRAEQGKNYGVILIPEGLIEFIPEMGELIQDLNKILADADESFNQLVIEEKDKKIQNRLPSVSLEIFKKLPFSIKKQLLLDRDPHGNVQVSKIATEKLLLDLVEKELKTLKEQGKYQGKFNAVEHFFGYEGRSGFPSNFDANYCYALGMTSLLLIREGLTGYMSCVKHLTKHPSEWKISGIPITSLFHLEERHGKTKPVIQKALVELKGKPFAQFSKNREEWQFKDAYQFPGPIQFFGPAKISNSITRTLELEQG
ncbi:MAG: diphosphate--fructose-6-phosphate 1-phosphotransferase [Simkaniaceae bacterium]